MQNKNKLKRLLIKNLIINETDKKSTNLTFKKDNYEREILKRRKLIKMRLIEYQEIIEVFIILINREVIFLLLQLMNFLQMKLKKI